jgi:ABC-type microcin C transport system permease subunit YejB
LATRSWTRFALVVLVVRKRDGGVVASQNCRGRERHDSELLRTLVTMVIVVIVVNLIADLLCAALDPRIEQ